MKKENFKLAQQLIQQGFTYPEVFRFLIKNAGLDYDAANDILRILDKNREKLGQVHKLKRIDEINKIDNQNL